MEYTGKKLFKVTNEQFDFDDCHIKVAIDFDFPNVKDKIKEMSLYWASYPDESASFEMHLKFFLRVLAADAVMIKLKDNLNDFGVQREFDNAEGYYRLDGSHGIALIHTGFPYVDCDDFEIESVKNYDGAFKLEKSK